MKKLILLFALLFSVSTSFISCRDTEKESDDMEEVGEDMEEMGDEVEDEVEDMTDEMDEDM